MRITPFSPVPGSTVQIDVTTASANVTLNTTGQSVYVFNDNNVTVWVELSGTASVNTSLPLATKTGMVLDKGAATVASAIASGVSGGNVTFTTGFGGG